MPEHVEQPTNAELKFAMMLAMLPGKHQDEALAFLAELRNDRTTWVGAEELEIRNSVDDVIKNGKV